MTATVEAEHDIIDPRPGYFKFSSGFEAEVVPMKTRQLFRLVRILTQGAGLALSTDIDLGKLFGGASDESGMENIIALLVLAIPEAEEASLDFLEAMFKPANLYEGRTISDEQRAANVEMWGDLAEELYNPEMEDLVGMVELIITREAPALASLGKRLTTTLELMSKTGQQTEVVSGKSTTSATKTASSGDSPARSTSSKASTAGPKKK